MSDIEKKALEEQESSWSDEELLPKEGETDSDYESRLSAVPKDRLVQFKQKVDTQPDSLFDLLPKPGEDDTSYEARLSTQPKERLVAFKNKVDEQSKLSDMQPREGEDDASYEKRLSAYSKEDLLKYKEATEQHEELTEQQKDVQWHKTNIEEKLKNQNELLTSVEAFGFKAGEWFGLLPVTKTLGAAEAAVYQKFKEMWNHVPEEHRKDFWHYYNRHLNALVGVSRAFEEAAPLSSFAGSFAGGLPGGSALFKHFSTSFKAAMADTLIGASMGVLESDARLNKGEYVDLLKDAGMWAAGGAVGGAVLRKAVDVVGLGVEKMSKVTADYVVSKLPPVGRAVEEEANALYEKQIGKNNALKKYVLASSEKYPGVGKASKEEIREGFELFKKVSSEEEITALKEGFSLKEIAKFKKVAARWGIDPADADAWVAWSEVRRNKIDFAKFHSRVVDAGELDKLLVDDFARVEQGFEWFRKADYATDLISDLINTKANGSWAVKTAMYFADARYALEAIESKWGMNLTQTLDGMTQKYNLFRGQLASIQKHVEIFSKNAAKQGMFKSVVIQDLKSGREYESNLMYAALKNEQVKGEEGKWVAARSLLNEKQIESMEQGQGIWKIMRRMAGDAGLPIKEAPDYVMDSAVRESEVLTKIDRLTHKLDLEKGITAEQYAALKKDHEFKDLLTLIGGEKRVRNAAEFNKAMAAKGQADFRDPNKLARASATYEKEGKIPVLIRQMDVPTLMMKWANNTLKYAHLRDDLLRMRGLAEMIKSKDGIANEYISKLITDVSGIRQGTFLNWMRNQGTKWEVVIQKKIDRSTNPVKKASLEGIKRIPSFLGEMQSYIYPNYLGWNPRVLIQNLMQPILMTQGELSGLNRNVTYAAKKLAKGYGLVAQLRVLGAKNESGHFENSYKVIEEFLRGKGLKAPDVTGEMVAAFEEGVAERLGKGVWNKIFKDWPMRLFSITENINRSTSYFAGVSVGDDLVKVLEAKASGRLLTLDEKASVDFIRAIQPGYRIKFKQLFKEWNGAPTLEARQAVEAEIRDVTGRYVSSKTQFNYNRMALSQFGREFGPLFSMFTKWPTSIASDVALRFKRHGVSEEKYAGPRKMISQYLAPLIALGMIDRILLDNAEQDPKGVERYLLGPKGLRGMAPLQSLKDMSGRGLLNTPVLDLFGRAVKSFVEADPKQGRETMERVFKAFVPGASYARLLLEDLDTLEGKRKEDVIHKFFKGEGE